MLELGEHALSGSVPDQGRLRAEQLLRERCELEAELLLEANGAQEPKRVVREDRLRDGAQQPQLQILAPAARIDVLAAADGDGDRVDGEVAAREIRLDRPVDGSEVDRPSVAEDDAPRRVPLRQGEREPTGAPRVRAR